MNPETANEYFNSAEVKAGVDANINEVMVKAFEKASEISIDNVEELINAIHGGSENVDDARTELETIKMTLQNAVDLSPAGDPLALSFSNTIAQIEEALAPTN